MRIRLSGLSYTFMTLQKHFSLNCFWKRYFRKLALFEKGKSNLNFGICHLLNSAQFFLPFLLKSQNTYFHRPLTFTIVMTANCVICMAVDSID